MSTLPFRPHCLAAAALACLTATVTSAQTSAAGDTAARRPSSGPVQTRPVTAGADAPAGAPAEPLAATDPVGDGLTAPVRRIHGGVVTVFGARPSSLPTVIPTTVEGVTGEEVRRTINATDVSDALKYLPSLLVRKRYPGDYDHAVLSTRASGTGNSARSLVYADGILLSNLLGNGANFTPRWGLVTPAEIERVDVLYGPFSAAYPGNSVGAVVDYVTRMPDRFEADARLGAFGYSQAYGGSDGGFGGRTASVALGDRAGGFAWWLHLSRLDSESHPLVYATRTPSTAAPAAGAVPVTGVLRQANRFGQDWLLVSASNIADTRQDQVKLKLAQRLGDLHGALTLGLWDNTVSRRSETWLRDTSGASVGLSPDRFPTTPGGSVPVAIEGRGYTLTAADLPRTRERLRHGIAGLTLRQRSGGFFDWEAAASRYAYLDDAVRAWSPVAATATAPANAVAGRLTDQSGTGWTTLAVKGIVRWDPDADDVGIRTEAGLQRDAFRLRNRVSPIAEWTAGDPVVAPLSRFEGDTTLTSAWVQQVLPLAGDGRLVAGLRAERWQASNGLTANGAAIYRHPAREETTLSPKLAFGWAFGKSLSVKASTGRAVRFPTVGELYQGGVNAATGALINGDPGLKPERSWTTELSAERTAGGLQARATLFHEDTRDALYSQTNTTVTPNVTNVQNVDRIETVGLELAGTAKDAGRVIGVRGLELSASVTYADSVIRANTRFPASVGKLQPRVPRWRGNLVATWQATDTVSATAGLRLARRQFNSLDNTDPNGAVYQGVSDFTVLDLRVVWKPSDRWSLSVGLDNAGNEAYWNFHPYPKRTWLTELRYAL